MSLPIDQMVRKASEFAEAFPKLFMAKIVCEHVHFLANECERLAEENRKLKDAIQTHRAQKADDRCIEDDDRLYEALGDGIKCDRRVGDKAAMLENCRRFIERRCDGGHWPTYQELETEVARLKALLDATRPAGLEGT